MSATYGPVMDWLDPWIDDTSPATERVALTWDRDADRHDPDQWVQTWWCDCCNEWVPTPLPHYGETVA